MRKLMMMLSIFGLLGCNPRSPGPLSRSHQGNQRQCKKCHTFGFGTRTAPEKCLACHRDIAGRIQARRGFHASAQSPKVLGTPCVRCHPEHRGPDSTLGLFTTKAQQEAFRPDHERIAGFPLRGKHATAECGKCHKDLLPSGWRTYLMSVAQYADCSPCHKSKHGGTFGKEACRTCHAAERSFIDTIPFDHDRTRFPLTGGHDLARMKDKCQTCHKPGASGVPALECSSCHPNPHRTRFNRQPQCSVCHTSNKWGESVFDHGKRTRFRLTGGHAAPTLKDCRSCHRGKDPSDFEDLRGLVIGSDPAGPFSVNCVGCHQHAKAHGGDVRFRQCLDCHDPGQEELKPNLNLKKMAYVGHPPGSPFPLTGGHDLTRMQDKCTACHRNVGQGFFRIRTDCFSCHKGTDQQSGHRGALGKRCEDCHDFRTGTWKDTMRFNHDKTDFPLQGKHQTTPCARCHPGANPATRFTLKKGPEVPACGDAACHQKDDTCHKGELGKNCGDRAGCHDPRDGSFSPKGRRCTKL